MTITQDLMLKMADKMDRSLTASVNQAKKNKTRSIYFKGKADAYEEAYNTIKEYARKHSRK